MVCPQADLFKCYIFYILAHHPLISPMTFWKKWILSSKHQPPIIKEYLQACAQKNERKRSIDELSFVVFDTETSGLDPQKAQLLSLGAVKVRQRSVLVEQSLEMTVFAPTSDIQDNVAIHGITQRELRDGLGEETILQHWLAFIGNAVLVAHHAAFDLAMMNQLCRKYYGIRLKNTVLDTAHLAKRLEHGTQLQEYIRPEDYSLDKLCERYGISPDDRHTAAGDAFITAQLLLKLLAYARKKGIRSYGELLR